MPEGSKEDRGPTRPGSKSFEAAKEPFLDLTAVDGEGAFALLFFFQKLSMLSYF